MIEYCFLPYHYAESEIKKFVNDNHAENLIDKQEFSADWDYFKQLSNAGALAVVIASHNNKIIGLSGYSITSSPNNKEKLIADNVIISVLKSYRSKVSKSLLNKSKDYLKKLNVKEINFLIENEKIGRFLKTNGFVDKRKEWVCEI
jgi:hypothetical protein